MGAGHWILCAIGRTVAVSLPAVASRRRMCSLSSFVQVAHNDVLNAPRIWASIPDL